VPGDAWNGSRKVDFGLQSFYGRHVQRSACSGRDNQNRSLRASCEVGAAVELRAPLVWYAVELGYNVMKGTEYFVSL
jgi:hypothetical protein